MGLPASSWAASYGLGDEAGRPRMGLVREPRMREARRLLGATALPISAVSCRTGPWDPASFARSFHLRLLVESGRVREVADELKVVVRRLPALMFIASPRGDLKYPSGVTRRQIHST